MDGTQTGRLLSGRYRLSAVIGRGGMGVVWQARDEVLKRDVAMKEIIWPPHLTPSEQEVACQRAFREAQIASRLSHLNVVRIYDILEEDGQPWIIMELLPYRSVRDLVNEEGPLTPAQAARIGLGVLAALRAAHAEGILHRDVKPANILVSPEGRVVLTDFGIARAADSPTLTGAGLIGSPSYTAPERARGGQAGAPADMWGLGASLYAAVEGHPPFERNGALQTLTAVVADELPRASRAGPLWPVISGLLRKDPDKRLTADDVERMLGRVAADGGIRHAISKSRGRKAVPAVPAVEAAEAAAARPDEPAAVASREAEPSPGLDTQPVIPDPEPGERTGPDPDPAVTPQPGPVPVPDREPAAAPEPVAALTPDADPAVAAPATSRSRRSRRPLAGLGALAAAAAAITAVALILTGSPRHQTAASGPVSQPASRAPSASPASPASPATHVSVSASPTDQPRTPAIAPRSTAASPGVSAAPYGAVTAGYYRFTNSTGFSIAVPDGWPISHVGHYVYISDPSDGNIFLLIDQSDQPKPNPLADWEQQQANRANTYPGYHLIRLDSVDYPQAEKAADWEFTFVRNGVLVQILNRNILANAHHAYALYWSVPESEWGTSYHYFQEFAATFRPAS